MKSVTFQVIFEIPEETSNKELWDVLRSIEELGAKANYYLDDSILEVDGETITIEDIYICPNNTDKDGLQHDFVYRGSNDEISHYSCRICGKSVLG